MKGNNDMDGDSNKVVENADYEHKEDEDKDEDKIRPKIFSTILSEHVKAGIWVPVDKSLRDYCIMYTQILEKKNKFKLTIWPNHCLVSYFLYIIQCRM